MENPGRIHSDSSSLICSLVTKQDNATTKRLWPMNGLHGAIICADGTNMINMLSKDVASKMGL